MLSQKKILKNVVPEKILKNFDLEKYVELEKDIEKYCAEKIKEKF